MVKRKAFLPLEEKLAKPWCYYCGKEWVDNKVLLSHMRDVHLKCDSCYRRLNTAGGLKVHKEQVHKEQLHRIENALPGRESIDIEVFVMEGIPEELVQARRKAIAEEHYREQNEYVQRTGNLPPGSTEPNPHLKKKPKLESTEDLKARVAALKKKKEAEKAAKANGGNVGVNTEYGSDNASPSPAPATSPGLPYQGHSAGPMPTFTPSFVPPQAMPMHDASPYPAYPAPYGHPPNPGQAMYGPPAYSPPQLHSGHAMFGPPAYSMAPSAPPQAMYAPSAYSPTPSVHQGSPPAPVMRDSSFNTSSASGGPSSLPSVPGLPPRPNFTVPNVSKEQMAQLHGAPAAHLHSQPPASVSNYAPPATAAIWNPHTGVTNYPVGSASHQSALDFIQRDRRDAPHQSRVINDDVDDYILRITTQGLQKAESQSTVAAKQEHMSDGKGSESQHKASSASPEHPAEGAVAKGTHPEHAAAQEQNIKIEPEVPAISGLEPKSNVGAKTTKKASKKQKGQRNRTQLVYSDNSVAPEEKKAKLEQYSPDWDMHKLPDTTLGSEEDAVSGVVDGTVHDPQG